MWLAVEALPPLPRVSTCLPFWYARNNMSPRVTSASRGSESIAAWSRLR